MMGGGGIEGIGGMMGGGLMMLSFWLVPIALVVWGLGSRFNTRPREREETPLEILQRRYASGEISQEEFEYTKRALV